MQLTAFKIAELSRKDNIQFFLYELTKTYKVIKHPITKVVGIDDFVLILIGDGEKTQKVRLIFTIGANSKKTNGDSTFYTDFNTLKYQFYDKKIIENLKEEIILHEKELKSSIEHLQSKKKALIRLEEGITNEKIALIVKEDKELKETLSEYLKDIFISATRYESDISFAFLVDRLWIHSELSKTMSKEKFIEKYEALTSDELNDILNLEIAKII